MMLCLGGSFSKFTDTSGFWHPPPTTPVNLTEVSVVIFMANILELSPSLHLKLYGRAEDAACAEHHVQQGQKIGVDVPRTATMATGFRGQYLIVVPTLNVVVVRLGHGWEDEHRWQFFAEVFDVVNPSVPGEGEG